MRAPLKEMRPASGLMKPVDDVEEGGLGAVGADEAGDAPLPDLEEQLFTARSPPKAHVRLPRRRVSAAWLR